MADMKILRQLRQEVPTKYRVQITDTFGGEPNYAWVRHCNVTHNGRPTTRAIVRQFKKQCGLVGRHVTANLGDCIEVRFPQDNIVAFIEEA